MKKFEYKAPEMEVIKLAATKFLCGSDPDAGDIPTDRD